MQGDAMTIEGVLAAKSSEMKQISEAAAQALAGKEEGWKKVASAIASLALTLGAGPAAGALAPLGVEVIAKAFGDSAATRVFKQELATLAKEEDQQALANRIADTLSVTIGQALIQIIRSQHTISDENLAALGGLRDDFEAFRNEFGQRIESDVARVAAVQIREQHVDGHNSIGVRVLPETQQRVLIDVQRVGGGATGVVLE